MSVKERRRIIFVEKNMMIDIIIFKSWPSGAFLLGMFCVIIFLELIKLFSNRRMTFEKV